MNDSPWAEAGRMAVSVILWIIASGLAAGAILAFSSYVGRKLAEVSERNRIDTERCQDLAVLAAIADEVEAMPDSPERRRLYREAELLGFLDSDDLPRKEA